MHPTNGTAGERLAAQVRDEQAAWRRLVDEVGRDRMDEPGPMGEWTFRDLAVHILGWRDRTIERLEAVAAGRPTPPNPWPAELTDDDAINDWYQGLGVGRSLDEVLAAMDASFDRLSAALASIPDHLLTDPAGLRGFEGIGAAVDVDWVSHWHDEHEADVRDWLASRDRAG